MLYSATAFTASLQEDDPSYYLKRQILFSVLGLAVMVVVIFIPTRIIRKFSIPVFLCSVLSLCLLLIPGVGSNSHGATRWLNVAGFSIQPAELVKLGVIWFLADWLPRIGRRIRSVKFCAIIGGMSVLLAGMILFISENLSSAIIVFGITILMLFLAHPKYAPFVLWGIAGCALAALVIFVISPKAINLDFRFARIEAWKNPAKYADSTGYQVLQSLYAIGSGGLFGKGLGKSAQKLVLPEARNDMIFSVICEELGVVGAAAVLLIFALILYRMVFIAKNAQSRFGGLLTAGVFIHIALQVVLNVMVASNLFPPTGITLPFISYGGSATLCLLFEIGMVFRVSREIVLEEA
jgi:cell division protein FtsW